MDIFSEKQNHQAVLLDAPKHGALHDDATPPVADNTKFLTGVNHIDSLLEGLSWTGNVGKAATVTYSFTGNSIFDVSDQLYADARYALRAWASVANIDFKYLVPGTANLPNTNILIGLDDTLLESGILGVTFPSFNATNKLTAADVLIAEQLSLVPGNQDGGYLAMMHEIGHAIGLKHPGNYGGGGEMDPTLPGSEDSQDASIMSYIPGLVTGIRDQAETPMIYDIAAAQYLYGANMSHNTGNDVYSFDGTSHIETIWDAGGFDTIDTSSTSSAARIDLREGLGNYTNVGQAYIWNAFGANIEAARGGTGGDTINGNGMANTLMGNKGSDVIHGGKGNDIINGNEGSDTLLGEVGNDSIFGGKGNDTMTGGAGNDVFIFLAINNGVDTVNDFLHGADRIEISSSLFATASAALAAVTYNGSDAVLNLDGSSSVTLIGSGTLFASDFMII